MRVALLAALAIAVVIVGCGGARLSRSAFERKANAVCGKYTAKIDAVPPPNSIGQVAAYVDLVKPYIERAVDEIAHLRPPTGLQRAYERWLASQRAALDQVGRLRTAAEKNDIGEVNATIKEINAQDKRGNALAARLGATVCARG